MFVTSRELKGCTEGKEGYLDSFLLIFGVLGWSLRVCLDKETYARTISPIPIAFSSVGEWATSFDIACREEFREQLQLSIEDPNSVDRIVQFEWLKLRNPNSVIKVRGQISSVKQVVESKLSDDPLGSLHGAIGIFTRGKGCLINHSSSLHFLCRVTVPKDDSPSQIIDVEFLSSCAGTEDFIATKSKDWRLFILDVTTIPLERTLDALASFKGSDSNCIFNEILRCVPSISGHNSVGATSPTILDSSPVLPLSRWLFQMRNEHQQEAILRVLNATMGRQQNCVQIIHGPPGTGKTATLVALLDSLMKMPCNRVFATAPTNQAICELANRCLRDIVLQSREEAVNLSIQLHEMVLVGNRNRLVLNDELDLIHLDTRIDRLDATVKGIWEGIMNAPPVLLEGVKGSLADVPAEEVLNLCNKCEEMVEKFMIVAAGVPRSLINEVERNRLIQKAQQLRQWCREVDATNRSSLEQFVSMKPEERVQLLLKIFMGEQFFCHNGIDKTMLRKTILERARLVFSTVSMAGSRNMVDLRHDNVQPFNVAIIDEATQQVEAGTAQVLSPHLKCLVLAGDNQQLPSTVISMLSTKNMYGRSLFDRALKNKFPSSLLRIQYRMRPELSFWPNMQFYEGKLLDGEIVRSESYDKYFHERGIPPLSVLDVTGNEEKVDGSHMSRAEVQVALCMVRQASILASEERAKNPLEFKAIVVGIITPYSAQRVEIERRLDLMSFDDSILQAKCRTVDGFQGQECDIIIFSAIRSAGIGFLNNNHCC